MIALDTSSLVHYLGGSEGADVEAVDVALAQSQACLPPVVLSEVLSDPKLPGALEQLLLEASGWQVDVAWGRARGADMRATKGDERWLIEAKGCGSRNPMRVNYFLCVLGELLQRMNDDGARYSIALPDMKQFRGLWDRLPSLAKRRTRISALFVDPTGKVEEVRCP